MSSKSVQWEPNRSMRTEGRTDKTKLIVAFRYLPNAPKNTSVDMIFSIFFLQILSAGSSIAHATTLSCKKLYIMAHACSKNSVSYYSLRTLNTCL
jgi:hypothetical protein